MADGVLQFGGNEAEAAFTLCQAVPTFHLHALTLIQIILLFITLLVLPWTTKRRARKSDSVFLAVGEIVPVPVDFIRQHPFWVVSRAAFVPLYHFCQLCSFVVRIKGQDLKPSPAIHDADIQLCAELHRGFGLAPDDGAEKRLTQTDNAIRNGVAVIVVHIFLLFVDPPNGGEPFQLPWAERFSRCQHPINMTEVPS